MATATHCNCAVFWYEPQLGFPDEAEWILQLYIVHYNFAAITYAEAPREAQLTQRVSDRVLFRLLVHAQVLHVAGHEDAALLYIHSVALAHGTLRATASPRRLIGNRAFSWHHG